MVTGLPYKTGIRKAGNAGLVTTTAPAPPHPGDLCHTMPTTTISGAVVPRTGRIVKIVAYNNTGANVTLLFGTNDRAAVPAFVQLLPDLVAINGLENIWLEEDIPAVEWASDTSLLAAGRTGDIYVVAGTVAVPVAGVLVSIEVEEYGA